VSRQSPRVPLLLRLYQEYLDRQDPTEFISKTSKSYTQGTLERLTECESGRVRRAAVLALGFLGDYAANHVVGRALHDQDRTVRTLAENAIRQVWKRAGNEQHRRQLNLVIRLNSAKQFREAIRQATRLTDKAPWFAEAWNQRAVAHFAVGNYAESIRDCHQTLELNPYHFAAASGMGQAYLQLGNHVSALESFRRALRLNPDLEAVRVHVVRLTRMIEDK
jgi:tetratricopeptide (TPR) repeat protein